MTLLVISPDFVSHYAPLAVLAGAARASGRQVVVATGPNLRERVVGDGFEWRLQRLGATANAGVAERVPAIDRFIAATRQGPVATIRLQAREREHDLLWQPEQVATEIAALCDDVAPETVLVDHVSFGSTLAMHATGRPFVTLVPGHPSQLPVGDERYGVPPVWPNHAAPACDEIALLTALADRVTKAFTERWNAALATVAPTAEPVGDAFRIHGRRVLYNSVAHHHDPMRTALLPADHCFVGPLVRDEALPGEFRTWADCADVRPRVYVAFGTFLSHRSDVLARVVDALRPLGTLAAIATGGTPMEMLGPIPSGWIVRPQLPQVALLRHADLAVHHGGNNSVQEALSAGVQQIVLPFSTDQFANAADLERLGLASVAAPNDVTTADLSAAIEHRLHLPAPSRPNPPSQSEMLDALFG